MSQLYWLEPWGPIVMLPGSTPAGGELLIPVTKVGTGPSGSGKNLPGEAGPLPDRAQGLTREAGNPGLSKKKKKASIFSKIYLLEFTVTISLHIYQFIFKSNNRRVNGRNTNPCHQNMISTQKCG